MHCSNNGSDRKKGEYWERQFCQLAADNGFVFTPLQIGRDKSAQAFSLISGRWSHWTLPDITIWTAPGQHHEIKHKSPTGRGLFGLEKYRLDALLDFASITGQRVLYTIHNHALNGGSDCQDNHLEHWFTADVLSLDERWLEIRNGTSWVNGIKKENVPICYWGETLWTPLAEYWGVTVTE